MIRTSCNGVRSLTAIVLSLALFGCSSTPQQSHYQAGVEQFSAQQRADLAELVEFYQRWQGTPYQLGGSSKRGIDCSAFTQQAYRDVFSRPLPRTTARQHTAGSKISTTELEPGDLVFFLPDSKVRHVGIYLSDGRFMHASTSAGVTISSLASPWWQRHHWKNIRPAR